MNLKEKYELKKQQKQARDFFRKNNNEIASQTDLMKTSVISFVVSVLLGFNVIAFSNLLNFMSLLFYILVGVACATVINKFVGKSVKSIKITTIIFHLIGMFIGVAVYFISAFGGVGFVSFFYALELTTTYLIYNLSSSLGLILSSYSIYINIK